MTAESSVGSDGGENKKACLVSGEIKDLQRIRATAKKNGFRDSLSQLIDDIRYSVKVLKGNPSILVASFLVFATLCGAGLGLVFFLAKQQNVAAQQAALDLAVQTGRWFCKYPLFAACCFIKHRMLIRRKRPFFS